MGYAMDYEGSLPEYSDRIAQDSHLIPSSKINTLRPDINLST